jgi:hypothetical protein
VIDAYVVWREACGHVQIAYERWTGREPCDRSFAFAAYLAALEHEEDTARLYERRIEHVRRAALQDVLKPTTERSDFGSPPTEH